MQSGFGLWRKLYLELRGLVELFSGCSEFVSTWGSICGYVPVTSLTWSVQGKNSAEHTCGFPGVFLIPPLNKRTVVEFLEVWVALLYRSRRQKLAVQSHTSTHLQINRRDEDSLRDRIYILEVWLLCQMVVGGVWTDVFSSDEALASCWCQFCVPNNYCLVILFR